MLYDKIHIVLSSDNHYARYMVVTMFSVLYNRAEGDELEFHILDGGICEQQKQHILRMCTQYHTSAEFISVREDLLPRKFLQIRSADHVSAASYYRLLIPSLIHADRCIYMDCDMICRSSLAPLWNIDLGDCLLAAVQDIDEEKHAYRLQLSRYFNSGLLLMNLEQMRQQNIPEQCLQFIQDYHERIVMHDQDVLNSVLQGRMREIPHTWNCQVCKTHQCKEMGFYALRRTASVLHFVGHRKPWHWRCHTPGKWEFWKYAIRLA